jgi:ubiquinone/menaquinone biosynthesis C-methylase UbiE
VESTNDQRRAFEANEIAYEDAMAQRYNRDYHVPAIMAAHDRDFARFVAAHFRAGDRVLDLGCGPASMWRYWAEYLPGHKELIGVDISPGMVSEARAVWPHGDFRIGSMMELPLPDSSIDLVIVSSAFHHLPDETLPDALTSIRRVLSEHGTLVGREPVRTGRLGDEPGWLSAAIMTFRHLVYRLTAVREEPEPSIGSHHHAYDPREFFDVLNHTFQPKSVEFRHPFSSYVARSEHPTVERIALFFDEWLGHKRGQEFYYAASHNFADADDVARCVRLALEERPAYDEKQFLVMLQAAAQRLERELEPQRRRRWAKWRFDK